MDRITKALTAEKYHLPKGRTTRGNAGDQQRTRRHGGGVQKIRSLRHFERPKKNRNTAAPIRAETSPSKAQRSEKRNFCAFFSAIFQKKFFPPSGGKNYGGIPQWQR